jgi:retron-type reverse transcriptase
MVRKRRKPDEQGRERLEQFLKGKTRTLSPRRLADWINLTGAKKVHSSIDKVYKQKNLKMAWEKVKENRGSGGVDGQSLAAFESQQGLQLARLEKELREDTYRPQPVLQHPIPAGQTRRVSHARCADDL